MQYNVMNKRYLLEKIHLANEVEDPKINWKKYYVTALTISFIVVLYLVTKG
jgi:hypothetical protein